MKRRKKKRFEKKKLMKTKECMKFRNRIKFRISRSINCNPNINRQQTHTYIYRYIHTVKANKYLRESLTK